MASAGGAYTTARLCRWRVFELDLQVTRLVNSYSALFQPATLKHAELAEHWRRAIEAEKLKRPDSRGDLKCQLAISSGGRVETTFSDFPARDKTRTVIVALGGTPRSDPLVKDARWIETRKAFVDPDAEETLLVDPRTGEVLEGSQTNVFVVKQGVVYTAKDHVLLGTVRAAALEACRVLSIPVSLCPPNAAEVEQWDEAFLASTSRLVLPIDVVGKHALPRDRPITERIRHWVEANVEERSAEIDEAALGRFRALDELQASRTSS